MKKYSITLLMIVLFVVLGLSAFAADTPIGLLVLSNLSLIKVLSLFSLTLTGILEESKVRWVPLISLSLINLLTRESLTSWKMLFSVSPKKAEKFSTQGRRRG